MKKVLVISSSLRKNGNSYRLARAFEMGAKDAGAEVEFVDFYGKTIEFCIGCYACIKAHRCFKRDDADVITRKMQEADVIVFSTPVYGYNICGQLKTLLDRCNPVYFAGYNFRDVYLLITAAEDNERAATCAIENIMGFIDNMKKSRLAGTVFAGGVDKVGDIEGHPALEDAYNMGKCIL